MKKILLLCSAGMSTSMVVQKMLNVAKEKDMDVEVMSAGATEFYALVDTYDIFLLGPQIKYKKDEFGKIAKAKNKPLDVINFKDYGIMNGEKILDFALNLTVE